MSVNIEAVAQAKQVHFIPQEIETAIIENVNVINEQIAELIENPLMKKEVLNRNNEKINDALTVLNAIYSSDFLNESPDEEDLKALNEYFQRANGQLRSGFDSYGNFVEGFSLGEINREEFNEIILNVLANMDFQTKSNMTRGIAPGSVAGSGIENDKDIVERLNNFVDSLTDIFLKRYQDAAQQTTNIYTEFAELNVAISEMISSAEVDSERNTIEMNVSALRTAIEELRVSLFDADSDIVKALKAIQFPAIVDGEIVVGAEEMAKELAEGAGLTVAGGPPDFDHFWLEVDKSAFDNITTAFESLTNENNQTGKDVIEVPGGTLQAFQTAIESVNNRVSTDNQTLIERLRNVTNQQQQTTQLFSSLLKEIQESNRGFLNKVA